jgi:phage baseplate assembly protein W
MRAIAHPLTIDAGLGQVLVEPDLARHADQMLRQLLLTNPGERVNRPDFGCGIRRLVFAPLNESASSLAQVAILAAIEREMASVLAVETVDVAFRTETIEITIAYRLKISGEKRILNFSMGA